MLVDVLFHEFRMHSYAPCGRIEDRWDTGSITAPRHLDTDVILYSGPECTLGTAVFIFVSGFIFIPVISRVKCTATHGPYIVTLSVKRRERRNRRAKAGGHRNISSVFIKSADIGRDKSGRFTVPLTEHRPTPEILRFRVSNRQLRIIIYNGGIAAHFTRTYTSSLFKRMKLTRTRARECSGRFSGNAIPISRVCASAATFPRDSGDVRTSVAIIFNGTRII